MKEKEGNDRLKGLLKLVREYRACAGDTEKAIREWAKAMSAENIARANGYEHVLTKPGGNMGEARIDAAASNARVHRLEAEEKMKQCTTTEWEKRQEMDRALDGFSRAIERHEAEALEAENG
jgi:hypothetical protein